MVFVDKNEKQTLEQKCSWILLYEKYKNQLFGCIDLIKNDLDLNFVDPGANFEMCGKAWRKSPSVLDHAREEHSCFFSLPFPGSFFPILKNKALT